MFSSFLKVSFIIAVAILMELHAPTAYAKMSNEHVQRAIPEFNKIIKKDKDEDLLNILALSEVLSDRLLDEQQEQETESTEIALFQAPSVNDIIDQLTGSHAPMVFVKGDPGSGKSAVIDDAVLKMAVGDVPGSRVFQEQVGNVITLRVSMRNFTPGLKDIQYYLNVVRTTASKMDRRIAVVFKDAEFVGPYIVSVLKDEAEKPPGKGVQVILEVDNKSYGNTIKDHPSLTSIVPTISINSPKPAQTIAILKKRDSELASRYDVKMSDDLLATIVDISPDYRRDVAEPRRSLQLYEKFVIGQRRNAGNNNDVIAPSKMDLYRFVAEQIKLPVLPQNEQEFANYMENVKKEIKEELVGQDMMVNGLVDQFVAALTSRTRQHTSAMLLGPTGVGKSYVGKKIAEKFYGDMNRFLELDMTQFNSAHALDSLFGAANGIVGADKDKGVLCDFFDGPGQGGGIVLLNEIEEMPAEALTRFMEMLDTGYFRGGDGKIHYVGKTMFIFTSNKNSDRILSHETIRGMSRVELNRRLGNITQDQMKKAFTEKRSYTEDSRKQAKPAVFERIDQFYFASPLLTEEGVKVAHLEVNSWVKAYNKENVTQIDPDPSVAEVATTAFYNEALGARQVRTSVNIFMSKAIQAFKKEFGYDIKNLKISATTHKSLKTVSYITVTDPATGNTKTIDGPRIPVGNRLLDKDFRTALIGLENNLNSEIFGQPEATSLVASALKTRFLKGGQGEVAAVFLMGVTGSGKSEMGKLVAKYLYGNEKAVGLFEMGKIQDRTQLNTILSPGKGYIGSDSPGELEQFLIQHPEGGVLLFDEISNAGGNDPALKQAIIKQFYTMMQEGYYRSPSGNVYNLRNHLILFTGNDGEDVTKGMTSDTMLEESYNQFTKDPNNVLELASKAGFTDAFMGRLSGIHLMRPTLTSTKKKIAKKMLDRWKAEVESNQPFKINYDQEFIDEVGILMFSPTTGARSINTFLSHTMGKLVADEALKADWDYLLGEGEKGTIDLSMTVLKPSKPFYEGTEPEKTEAILKSVLTVNKREISVETIDFTKRANFAPTVHVSIAEATAYHEMGHAVTTYPFILGLKLIKVTIAPEKLKGGLQALGYAQFRPIPRNSHSNKDFLIKSVAGLFSGSEAESMYNNNDWNGGRSNDVQRATAAVRKLVLESHINPEFDAMGVYLDKNGNYKNVPQGLQDKFDAYVVQVIEEGKEEARTTLKAQWHVIDVGSKLLMEIGSINEWQIEALFEEGLRFQTQMDELIASGHWSKEKAAEIGRGIDLAKVKAAASSDCVKNLTLAGADAERK